MPLSLMLDKDKFNQVMVIQLFALSFFINMFWYCVGESHIRASCDEQPMCYNNWSWLSLDSDNKLSHVLQLFLIGTKYLWKNHHCYYIPGSRLSKSLMVDLEMCEIQSWKGWLGNFSRNLTSSWCRIPYFGKSQPDREEFELHWSCYLFAYILRRTLIIRTNPFHFPNSSPHLSNKPRYGQRYISWHGCTCRILVCDVVVW